MGGFAGGDEAGFWDIDTITASMNKQAQDRAKNSKPIIKAPIEKSDSGYSVRAYVKAKELYDIISFEPCKCETFTIEGCDELPLTSNSIYRAYKALLEYTNDPDISDFFGEHKVVVSKAIPSQTQRAGASSHTAAFMHLLKEVCNLILSSEELAKIGSTIDADVPFFIYNPCTNT